MSDPADPASIQRGDYSPTPPLLRFIFTTGRLASGPLQYYIATRHPLSKFGLPAPPNGSPPTVTVLGHVFPRLPFLVGLMPGVLGLKHALWVNFMMKERMTPTFTGFAVFADLVYEVVSTLVFTAAARNPLFSERLFNIGFTLYMSSVALELVAELQRIRFKSKPENKGKLYTSGFWAITRHINYTANVLFGFGYGLATGGQIYAIMTGGMYLANFTTNAMPGLEKYCKEKYGKEWERYTRDTPYQLIPWVY